MANTAEQVTDGLAPLHSRNYQVEAFRRSPQEFVLIGSIIDRKPGGYFIETDPEPFTLHHMVVELTVSYPDLVIVGSDVTFNTFPQELCPAIAGRYGDLVGISIARGFTHQVRERFGGPRGCSHTTALLQAMAPVAVQCIWSMVTLARREAQGAAAGSPAAAVSPAPPAVSSDLRDTVRFSINSCHVWDEDGDFYRAVRDRTRQVTPMLPLRARLEELGVDPEQWAREHPGG